MYATKPSRFYVEWESSAALEKLEKVARANGTYMEDCDDWWDPAEPLESDDGGETIECAREVARMHLHDAHYGEVRIRERYGIEKVGAFWDYDDSEEVETVT